MQILVALLLAVIQGITEFIPISSSGHLAVAQLLLGFQEPPVAFDVVLHAGTLIAVLIYYRKDLMEMIRSLRNPASLIKMDGKSDSPQKLMLLLIIACIPTAVMGVLLKSMIESAFSDLRRVAFEFLIGGALMFATLLRKKYTRGVAEMNAGDALIIGVMQGVSLFPAISRSGATISAALLLGIRPDVSARFSFLLSIPAILGAIIFEAGDIQAHVDHGNLLLYLISGVVAGIFGYLSIRPLIRIIQAARFHYFAYYCWIAGLLLLAYLWLKTI
jgi:undecaprenyl-diphosphatase